ncbi:MAG UNVERIFIED_CONTAM: zinc-binding dehydrogenase [Rickettsiaceae bacterium]
MLIRHEAIGVNFIDYEYLRGSIKSNAENLTPGIEAVGIVEAVGKDVTYIKVGQRVGYATANSGAYAEYRTIKSYYVFPIHDSISSEAAALNMVKGMSAHYLMRRTFFLREGMTILIHGAASNLGKLMIKLAKEWKIQVIGSARSEEKINNLLKLGISKAFNYNVEDQEKTIMEYTKNQNVSVVYDFIGGPLLKNSLKCLVPFGLAVSAGNAMAQI